MHNTNIRQTYNQQQQQYQQRGKRSPMPQVNYHPGSEHNGDANNYNQNNQDRRQSKTRDTLE